MSKSHALIFQAIFPALWSHDYSLFNKLWNLNVTLPIVDLKVSFLLKLCQYLKAAE